MGFCSSTPTTQTSPAAAVTNVSAHGLVYRARTKIKVGSPLAKHVPVVLTALLVRQVVRILQLLVLLEPMPVVQTPFVSHVVLGNIMTKQVKRLNQLLAKVALLENTKTKREKHPATTIV